MSKACPYLIEVSRQRLTCMGPEEGVSIGHGFSRPGELQEYQKQYCYNDYPRCPLAQAIEPVHGLIAPVVCPYNDAVDCQNHNDCTRCGWNPAVAQERLQAYMDAAVDKLGNR